MGNIQLEKLALLEWMASLQDSQIIRELTQWKEEHQRVSLEQYNKELEEADSEIEKGDFLTHEEAIQHIRAWRED